MAKDTVEESLFVLAQKYQVDGEISGFLPETFITRPNALMVRVPDPWLSYSEIWQKQMNQKK